MELAADSPRVASNHAIDFAAAGWANITIMPAAAYGPADNDLLIVSADCPQGRK
jgi:hypothetical protein